MRRITAIDGYLVVEPELPPNTVCGGHQTANLPNLEYDELRFALRVPGLSAETLAAIRAELDRRTPDLLCSLWIRNRHKADAEYEADKLLVRLRAKQGAG